VTGFEGSWWNMNTMRHTRRFSLRAFLLWVLLLSLSFGMFRWGAESNSQFVFFLGLGFLGLASVLAWVALQRCWRYTTALLTLLVAMYTGIYFVLSANGRYEPAIIGIDHVKWYGWAPLGFVQEGRWNATMMRAFLPLWFLDVRLCHPDVSEI
jgi:hypothetical protein